MSINTYWAISLGLGLIVIVAAVVLLQVLLNEVHRVERGASAIWAAGKQVARNTATTWMLTKLSGRLDSLTAEALRHDEFLRSTGGNGH